MGGVVGVVYEMRDEIKNRKALETMTFFARQDVWLENMEVASYSKMLAIPLVHVESLGWTKYFMPNDLSVKIETVFRIMFRFLGIAREVEQHEEDRCDRQATGGPTAGQRSRQRSQTIGGLRC